VIRFFSLFFVLMISLEPSYAQTNADSSVKQKDSLMPVDSSRQDSSGVMEDSSLARLTDSLTLKSPEIPESLDISRKVLAGNPYFNFLGKRQTQMMQEHRSASKDYLFYLILVLLLYFGLIKVLFEKYINNLFLLFFRGSLRKAQIREQLLQTPLPSLLLNILFFVSSGLYASFLANHYHLIRQIELPVLFVLCSFSILCLYMIKFALLRMAGWIFNLSEAADIYIFIVFLVNKMMGILLLPFLVIMAFSANEGVNEVVVTISLIMIAILFIYRFATAYKNLRNEIKLSIFHFFIYLCAFEITPVVLIYKVLLAYLEKAS